MKKICAVCLAVVIFLLNTPVLALSTTADIQDLSISAGCNTLDGQVPFLGNQQLISNAKSAILYETNSDTLMYAHNADEQIEPSSLLKILTALIAIEKGNLDDVVTVRSDVLETLDPDAVVVGLKVDEVVTVKDLLYCMLVSSGNDAAVVLADHVMGSQEAFVQEMNRYAAELGCTATNFTNVHGIYEKNQYTTARDLVRILRKAIQNETFAEVFGAIYYTVQETNKSSARHLTSQNYLMNNDQDVNYFDERVVGGRTGANNDRSRSVASVAKSGDMCLIAVVIGSNSQFEKDGYTVKVYGAYNETTQLLDMGFNGHRTVQIIHPDQVLQQYSVLNGDCDVMLGAKTAASSVIPENVDAVGLTYRYANEMALTAPIKQGQTLSTLQVYCGSVCIGQTEVYAMNSVSIAGTKFSNSGNTGGGSGFLGVVLKVIGIFVAIIFAAFIVLLIMRAVRIAKKKSKARRYQRYRRRSK